MPFCTGTYHLVMDTRNTLAIQNKEEMTLCQFYCDNDYVTEEVWQDTQFVLQAANDT